MPRIPDIPLAGTPTGGPSGRPIAAALSIGQAVSELGGTVRQLALDFEHERVENQRRRVINESLIDYTRRINELELFVDDMDPAERSEAFDERSGEIRDDIIGRIGNEQVRDALGIRFEVMRESKRSSIAEKADTELERLAIESLNELGRESVRAAVQGTPVQRDILRQHYDEQLALSKLSPVDQRSALDAWDNQVSRGIIGSLIEQGQMADTLPAAKAAFRFARELIDDDEQLAGLTPDERNQLRDTVRRAENVRLDELSRGLMLDLFTGIQLSETDEELEAIDRTLPELVRGNIISDAQAISLRRAIFAKRADDNDSSLAIGRVESAFARGYIPAPSDVDVHWEKVVKPRLIEMPAAEGDAFLRDYIAKTQYIPKDHVGALRLLLASPNAQQAVTAASAYMGYKEVAPVATQKAFKRNELLMLEGLEAAIQLGRGQVTNVEGINVLDVQPFWDRLRSTQGLSEKDRDVINTRINSLRKDNTDSEWLIDNSKLLEKSGGFLGFGRVAAKTLPIDLVADFETVVEENFAALVDRMAPDAALETARKAALQHVSKWWGTTDVGIPRLTVLPMEKLYPEFGGDSAIFARQLADDLATEGVMGPQGDSVADFVKTLEGGMEEFMSRLIPFGSRESFQEVDPKTGRFAPGYDVVYTDGVEQVVIYTKDGTPFRFYPDWELTPEGKEQRKREEDEHQESILNRENQERIRQYFHENPEISVPAFQAGEAIGSAGNQLGSLVAGGGRLVGRAAVSATERALRIATGLWVEHTERIEAGRLRLRRQIAPAKEEVEASKARLIRQITDPRGEILREFERLERGVRRVGRGFRAGIQEGTKEQEP